MAHKTLVVALEVQSLQGSDECKEKARTSVGWGRLSRLGNRVHKAHILHCVRQRDQLEPLETQKQAHIECVQEQERMALTRQSIEVNAKKVSARTIGKLFMFEIAVKFLAGTDRSDLLHRYCDDCMGYWSTLDKFSRSRNSVELENTLFTAQTS